VLKDELHLPAEALQRLALEPQHIDKFAAFVENDLPRIRLEGAQQDLAQCSLAAAALANKPEALAARDLDADAVDRRHPHGRAGAKHTAVPQSEALLHLDAFDERR